MTKSVRDRYMFRSFVDEENKRLLVHLTEKTVKVFRISITKDIYDSYQSSRSRITERQYVLRKLEDISDITCCDGSKKLLRDICDFDIKIDRHLLQSDRNIVFRSHHHYKNNKQTILYIKKITDMANPPAIKLVNPIIVDYDIINTRSMYPSFSAVQDRFRGLLEKEYELEVTVLCDSCEDIESHSFFSKNEILKFVKDFIKYNFSKQDTKNRQPLLNFSESSSEKKAKETLRDLVSEKIYRKYLVNGFVSVMGKSGLAYQIFKNQQRVKVFKKGTLIKELCIHTDAKEVPPTDHILNIKLLVELDEKALWSASNKYEPVIDKQNSRFSKFSTFRKFPNISSFYSSVKRDALLYRDMVRHQKGVYQHQYMGYNYDGGLPIDDFAYQND